MAMPTHFLIERTIININKTIEESARKDTKIIYINRKVPPESVKILGHIESCAEEYYKKTKDIFLTATYYLKNIIVLQALEDANHRTGIVAAKLFLGLNGYKTKEFSPFTRPKNLTQNDVIESECFIHFKTRLYSYREREYHFTDSIINDYVLRFENTEENTSENIVFDYCYKFIINKLLDPT